MRCACAFAKIKAVRIRARGTSVREQITSSSKEPRLRNISSSSVYVLVSVCHIDSTRPDWKINRAHMWDSLSPNPHTLSQQQNPQLDLCASLSLSYCPLIPSFWTPISSRRGFMRGRTSSLRRNTVSIGLSTALFQTRHPLNRGITVIQPLDDSISFYLPLSVSFRLHIRESDVINIDPSIVSSISFLCISD